MEKHNNQYNEYAFALIIDEFEGEITEEQRRELQEWRNVSAENEQIYRDFYSIKTEIDSLADFRKIDPNSSWEKISGQLKDNVVALDSDKGKQKHSYKWIYSIAASVILLCSLFLYKQANELESIETAKGGHKRIILPDGSWVALNEETIIQFSRSDFKTRRELNLIQGQAYFQVTHNPKNPFIIKTKEASIEDLGTTFLATRNEKEVSVLVNSGKVELKSLSTGEAKVITPGRVGIYTINQNKITNTPASDTSQLKWLNTQLTFVNASLKDIVTKLQEVYGKEITIKDSSLRSRRLTAPLRYQTVDSALSVISASLQVKVIKNGNGYMILK